MTDDVIVVDSLTPEYDLEEFDLHKSFLYYNDLCFDGFLNFVRLSWSKRLTYCAGLCVYKNFGLCEIKLSESILRYRSAKECKETLLHEMIHAYLFLKNLEQERSHGKMFIWHMNRVNEITGLNVTVFHDFVDEVDYFRKHIWRCNGPCRFKAPYFGYIKRSINRAPGPNDLWWARHRQECNGKFVKISSDLNLSTKKRVKRDKKHHQSTILKCLNSSRTTSLNQHLSPGSISFPIVIPDTS